MIRSPKPFVVYKSSAGSGKTFTLAKSYLSLALSGPTSDYFKTILAITFTNKAANEMKERILNSLRDFALGNWNGNSGGMAQVLCEELKINKSELQKKSLEVYSLMLHRYNDINISTIDRFVHRIVKAFAHELNLPLNFEVRLDENILLAESVFNLIQSANEREDLFDLLVKFAEEKTDEENNWNIENELIKSSAKIAKEDSSQYLNNLSGITITEFKKIRNELLQEIEGFNQKIKLHSGQALTLIEKHSIDKKDFYFGLKGIGTWFERVFKTDWVALEYPNSYVQKAIYEDVWYSKTAHDSVKQKIDAVSENLKVCAGQLLLLADNELPRLKILQGILANFYNLILLNEIDFYYKKLLKDEGLVTISEFNKRINRIINTEPAPFIYERLGEKYHHFLIDEFQDTSVMQFQNFLPLIDNALAEQYNCLLVGDSKQAIYRWRGGAIEQMDTLPNLLEINNHPLLAERQETIRRYFDLKILKNNYRSKKNIVEFNNRFFKDVKSFLEPQFQAIYNQHEQIPKPGNEGGWVKCLFIEESRNNEERNPKHLNALLNEINYLTQNAIPFSEMAIITRENKDLILISEFLISKNLPVVSSESVLIKNSNQVKFIINYLNWINNPRSSLTFYNWLYSAVKLQLFDREELIEILNNDPLGDSKLKKEIFEKYLYDVNFLQLSLSELVEGIINSFLSNKNPYNAYLVSFLDVVRDFTNNNFGTGIADFLDYWKNNENKLAIQLSANRDAIQIVTIHKSKGLEFPYVLMPFANWEIELQNETQWVANELENVNLPCYLIKLNKNLLNTAYEDYLVSEQSKSLLDNINLLYVAFTRAEKGLIIFTDNLKEDKNSSYAENNFKNVSQILNRTFLKTEADGNIFEIGELDFSQNNKSQKISTEESLSYYSFKLWTEKVKIRAGKEYDEDWKNEKQILYGEAFHTIMEKYLKQKNFNSTLEFINSFDFDPHLSAELIQTFQQLSNNNIFKAYLDNYDVLAIEQDIILPGGEFLRPDLVLVKDKKLLVIDFKTGDKLDKHRHQIEKYKNAMAQIYSGYSVDTALIYVSTNDVEIINA